MKKFNGQVLLADSMGLGKTIQVCKYIADEMPEGLIVIVCPAIVKWHWKRELKNHVNLDSDVLSGTNARPELFPAKPKIIIVNYEILQHWLKLLQKHRIGLIVCDECHMIKNPTAKRTNAVRDIARRCEKKIFISGTPMLNRPIELFPVLNMLKPKLFTSRLQFGIRFCRGKRTPFGWDFRGASRTQELNKILVRECMIRRLKEDVLHDLPEHSRVVIPIEIDNREEYQKAASSTFRWIREAYKEEERQDRKLALSKITELRVLVSKLKQKSVVQWIENFLEGDEKLIVFAVHKAMIRAILSQFSGAVSITGDTSPKDRQLAQDRFNKDESCRLFVGNIQAAGVGWSASNCCHVAFAEFGWTPGEHVQAEDRVRGLNRGKGIPSIAYYLAAYDTIDEMMARALQVKKEVSNRVMDNQRGQSDFNIMSMLINEIKNANN